jgi:hypothetical protein
VIGGNAIRPLVGMGWGCWKVAWLKCHARLHAQRHARILPRHPAELPQAAKQHWFARSLSFDGQSFSHDRCLTSWPAENSS